MIKITEDVSSLYTNIEINYILSIFEEEQEDAGQTTDFESLLEA